MNDKIGYLVIDNDLVDFEVISNIPKINYGRITEKIVRKNAVGISEIARRLGVTRKTIYNWFETENLSYDIINKIGSVIDHDFSIEFPNKPQKNFELERSIIISEPTKSTDQSSEAVFYWMDRYIKLLEKFNTVLSHDTEDLHKS